MRRFALFAVAILVVLALVAVVVPLLVRSQAVAFFQEEGMGVLRMDNVTFNPVTLVLSAGRVVVTYREATVVDLQDIVLDLAFQPLVTGDVVVERFAIAGGAMLVREDDSGWYLTGLPAAQESAAEAGTLEWQVEQAEVDGVDVRLDGESLSAMLNVERLVISSLGNREVAPTEFSLDVSIDGAPVSLSGTVPLAAGGEGLAVGLNVLRLTPASLGPAFADLVPEGRFDMEASLAGSLAGSFASPAGWGVREAEIRIRTEADGLAISVPGFGLVADSAKLVTKVAVPTSEDHRTIDGTFQVRGEGLRASDRAGELDGRLEALSIDGSFSHQPGLYVLSDVDIRSLTLEAGDVSLVSADAIEIVGAGFREVVPVEQVAAGGPEPVRPLAIAGIGVSGLDLLDSAAQAARVSINGVDASPGEFLVRNIELHRGVANVVLDAEGNLLMQQQVARLGDLAFLQPAVEAPAADPLVVKLGRFELVDGAQLRIEDRSFTPTVERGASLSALTVESFSMNAAGPPAQVSLAGSFSEFSTLRVEGEVKVDAPMSVNLVTDLNELPMHDFSPWLVRAIGYDMTTGQLDLDLDLGLEGSMLDATADVHTRHLAVERASDSGFEDALGMPLGAALNLVRDGNDDITLDGIQVSGDLASPDVSLDRIIGKALSGALVKGSVTFLKFALQPYGAMLMAAEMVSKEAGRIRLDPLVTRPGETGIEPSQLDYLDRLKEILERRPGLRLVACGEASRVVDVPSVATGGGNEVAAVSDNDRLVALAAERSLNLKRVLVAAGVDSSRIADCQPVVTDAPDGNRIVLSVN